MSDAIDLNAPVAQAQSNFGTMQSLLGQQGAQNTDFLNRYRGAISGQESVPGMASRLGGELGLPALQSNANQLNQTLSGIPGVYNSASRGFDVNSNQLARTIGQKQSEIAPLAQTATTQAQNAQNSVDRQMGYTQQEQQKQLQPYQTEQTLQSEQQARAMTGYSNMMQQELDAISNKVQNGITLSEGEKNRANQLLMAENQYKAQMEQQKQSQQYQTSTASANPATSYQTIGGHTKLINSQTGQVIADLGMNAAPSAGGSGW